MDNSQKFSFSDFTFKAYENTLRDASTFYSFITHKEYIETKQEHPFLIWRHDIDMSIENAVTFAEIENRLGIVATYFVHLHSEYYHYFEKATYDAIKKIQSFGHHIGLHFDSHFYDIRSEIDLDRFINSERIIIEDLFDCKLNVFSFHNTNAFILSSNKLTYGGLINTYAELFQKGLPYCSDSYGIWRFERLPEILKQRKFNGLQVLTHPELWTEEVSSPYQRVMNCIFNRANKLKLSYDEHFRINNLSKIDW